MDHVCFGSKADFALQQVMSALLPIATLIAFFGMSALGQKRTSLCMTTKSVRALRNGRRAAVRGLKVARHTLRGRYSWKKTIQLTMKASCNLYCRRCRDLKLLFGSAFPARPPTPL